MTKKALITGITGQDGSYLAEFLLQKGYEVHGIIRRSSSFNTGRLREIYEDPHAPTPRLYLHYGDLSDGSALNQTLRNIKPDEILSSGSPKSHVRAPAVLTSLNTPETLQASARFGCSTPLGRAAFQPGSIKSASSSEMFRTGFSETPRKKPPPFIRVVPTAARKSTPIGSRSIIEKPIRSSPVTVFFLITSRPVGEKRSFRGKYHAASLGSRRVLRKTFIWGISPPGATGAMPPNTWKPCG